ncbi:hypothetical protein KAU37_11680 [Candidatus Bipolaricaulota bacterium]|nr:hypothetical protein [Candidatus Bipolaricaulota bacterium]
MTASDPLVYNPGPLTGIDDRHSFLASDPEDIEMLRRHTRTGRPCGDGAFLATAEGIIGRPLKKRPPKRKPEKK